MNMNDATIPMTTEWTMVSVEDLRSHGEDGERCEGSDHACEICGRSHAIVVTLVRGDEVVRCGSGCAGKMLGGVSITTKNAALFALASEYNRRAFEAVAGMCEASTDDWAKNTAIREEADRRATSAGDAQRLYHAMFRLVFGRVA
jgi:hypothetical protein